MNKYYTFFLLFLFNALLIIQPILLNAQVSVSGKSSRPAGKTTIDVGVIGEIIDDTNQPVPYASVVAYSLPDTTMLSGTVTDELGRFQIILSNGNYLIEASFLSFKKVQRNISVNDEVVRLGQIMMREDNEILEEFEVRAEKSQMQLQLDKRVFNVGKDLINAGANASDILDNVPSVTVDGEGNVSLRGSQQVRILVDGKPSALLSGNPGDALKQLQGNLVEKIEVITNPSARYDAEGEVGIINIVLKKEKRKGVNGSFDLATGIPNNHSAAYNINFRRKNVNLFSSYSVNYRTFPSEGLSFQEINIGEGNPFIYQNTRNFRRGGLGNTFKLGADINLSETSTISFYGLYRYRWGGNDSNIFYEDFDPNGNLTRSISRITDETEIKNNIEASINYVKTFKQKGHKFTADFQWFNNDDTENADMEERILNGSDLDDILQRSSNTEDERNFLVQSDYIKPFGASGKGKFEAGFRGNFRLIDNSFSVEQDFNGLWQKLPSFNNTFLYTENIYAAYVMVGNQLKRFSWQFGLRNEYTDIGIDLSDNQGVDNKRYNNLFPSAHFSYELNKGNSFQLSYSRRLTRPRFWSLVPFTGYGDNRNIWRGNPDLDPEFSNAFELGYLKYWDNASFMSSVYYRYKTDVIERIQVVSLEQVTATEVDTVISRMPVNLATQHAVGLEFNFNYDVNNWWRLNGNANFYRAITQGSFQDQNLYADTYTWDARINNRFILWKKLEWQTSFNYEAPAITTQGRRLAIYHIDIGLSTDVLKGNGTVSFNVRDLLNSRRFRSITETDMLYAESDFQWRPRTITMSFNYRLNQQKRRGGRGGGNYGGY